jgi:hypothetical protein
MPCSLKPCSDDFLVRGIERILLLTDDEGYACFSKAHALP